jgi:hypothetical protein
MSRCNESAVVGVGRYERGGFHYRTSEEVRPSSSRNCCIDGPSPSLQPSEFVPCAWERVVDMLTRKGREGREEEEK